MSADLPSSRRLSSSSWWATLCSLVAVAVFLIEPRCVSAADASRASANGPYCGIYAIYAASILEDRPIAFKSLLKPEYVGCGRGSSLAELYRAATDAGFHALPVQNLSPNFLRESRAPVILNVRSIRESPLYDHWVLYCGDRNGIALVIDSDSDVQEIKYDELSSLSNGIGLIVSSRSISHAYLFWPSLRSYGPALLFLTVSFLWLRQRASTTGGANPSTSGAKLSGSLGWACVLTSAAVIAGVSFNAIAADGLLRSSGLVQLVQTAEFDALVDKVDVKTLAELRSQRTVLLVDARLPDDYAIGHIEGAINLPVDADDVQVKAFANDCPRNRRIIVYCESLDCPYAVSIAQRLHQLGCLNVAIFPPGWRGWIASHPDDRR